MAWTHARSIWRPLAVSAATAAVSLAAHSQTAEVAATSYQDHYISNGTLAPNISYGEGGYSDQAGGLARSLRVDAVLTAINHHTGPASSDINESGAILESQWDTASYGGWSLAGSAQTTSAGNSNGNKVAVAIQQRDFAIDGAWHVNNGLGTINSNNIALLRTQQRFFLPTTPILGAASEWFGPHNLQLVGSFGEPGIFEGVRVPGFQTEGGTTATLGAQWSPAAAWALGGQVIDAHDVSSLSGFTTTTDQKQSSSSALLTAAWHNPFSKAQLNLIDGSVSGTGGGSGAWLDASITTGRLQQDAGLFHVDPNLSWGNQPIVSDAQGGYYRSSYQSRRWQTDLGVDYLDSISGRGASTTYYSGSTRYQLSRDFGIGGVANVREASGARGWSTAGYVDWRNRLGISRAQVNYAEDSPRQDAAVTLDQAWDVPQGMRLSTSLSLERLSGTSFEDHTAFALSVYGGGDLTARLSIDGNVRWAHAIQGNNAPASSANVELVWQLSSNWSMLATYYESHTGAWNAVTVTSPLAPPDLITSPASEDQGVFFTVRYQRASGAHFAPLGGPPGTGWGTISGTVYLDKNENDLLDANETGAANVTVVLDGRYSARTDAQGRYEFPAVAAGRHELNVVPDNLPLPWIIPGEGSIQILVETRKRTTRDIGARRSGGTRS
jgi:hypothetical protein